MEAAIIFLGKYMKDHLTFNTQSCIPGHTGASYKKTHQGKADGVRIGSTMLKNICDWQMFRFYPFQAHQNMFSSFQRRSSPNYIESCFLNFCVHRINLQSHTDPEERHQMQQKEENNVFNCFVSSKFLQLPKHILIRMYLTRR